MGHYRTLTTPLGQLSYWEQDPLGDGGFAIPGDPSRDEANARNSSQIRLIPASPARPIKTIPPLCFDMV